MKETKNNIGKVSAIALALALSCSAVAVNTATASNHSTQISVSEQHEIIEHARKKIEKERAAISKQQDKIAKERTKIIQERQNIVEQRAIIASAAGKNKEKIIDKAKKEISKSKDKIAKSKEKIEKAKDKIVDAKAEIALQRDIIALAKDAIASTKDSDNDGVANNIDLCPDTPVGDAVDADGCTLPPESDWSLVWNDEFDGTSIDSSKWTHEINCDGGGNQEKQCYTDSAENSFVEDGKLKIVALSETGQSLPYSSARLVSKDQGDWTYGRFEIRAKAPKGQGSWPAIWMLPTDNVYGGWPHSGEVDIFESVNLGVPLDDGAVESHVHGTLHYGESWPNNDSSGQSYLLPGGENPADDFHLYVMEWEEGEIRWYVDGVLYETQLKSEVTFNTDGDPNGLSHRGWYREQSGEYFWDESPFDSRFHMILNFAVGGSWPEAVNQGGVDASAFNASNAFEVDYVRVYECSIMPNTGQGCATVTDNYLDPVAEGGTLVDGKAPTPIEPSTGVGTDLIIFDNTLNENWPAFVGDVSGSYSVEFDDGDHFEVVEFSFGAAPMVAGFNTTIADSPTPYDGSPWINTGVLEFDLKLVTAPNNAAAPWFLKVEQGGQASAAELPIVAPVLDEWQHYAIPLKTLNTAGLVLNGIDVVMMFPAWGQGEGAVFRVDNVTILEGEAPPPIDPTGNALTDFEGEPGSYVFNDFDGGVAEVVANPVSTGINTSAQVGQMLKYAGQPWGGTTLILDEAIDIPAATVIGLKVWSQRQVPVLFKLEGMNVERSVTHDGNGWQDLRFDFSGDSGVGVSAITLIFDLGTMGDAAGDPSNWTFYFDDMILPGAGDTGGNATINIADGIDFEGEQAVWETFENGDPSPPLEFVANPNASGGNTSSTVAKLSLQAADPGTGMWAGAVTHSVQSFALDASNAIVKVWVYKDKISPVGIKFEKRHGDGWGAHPPRFVSNTLINQWEELTFDFTDDIGLPENDAIEGFAIYPDNLDGRASNIVYFDNVTFSDNGSGGGTGGASFSTDFEAHAGSYLFSDFDGGVASIISNPEVTGINTSSQVGQMLKFAGQHWGGSTLALDSTINMPAGTVFTMKVWSQRPVPVLFKLEGLNVERSINHGGSGWEELSFDFGGDNGSVPAISLIFDLGTMGDAASDPINWTFYFDDIVQHSDSGGGTGGDLLPIDFEAGGFGASLSWNVFENVDNPAVEFVANPDTSGINDSSTVAKIIARADGAPWVGAETAHGDIGPFTLDATNSTIKIMVYKAVISDVGIKFAIANGGAQPEIKVSNTLVNRWEELTFDFSGYIGLFESIDIDQIIVFPDFNLDGRGQENVVYFDNITFN